MTERKIERVIRTRRLTPAEVARDDTIRRQDEKEFPPARDSPPADPGSLSEVLREAIRGSHKSLGEEAPRRFLEVLGGTRWAPPSKGSGRLDLARQLVAITRIRGSQHGPVPN